MSNSQVYTNSNNILYAGANVARALVTPTGGEGSKGHLIYIGNTVSVYTRNLRITENADISWQPVKVGARSRIKPTDFHKQKGLLLDC
jgi:hypothetical protein